ncbi:MAG: penicillin-binding protein [Synechococcaceae cyanobacterium SM2_3_2]|nr:penicillin-binding protein [Synechococcaceae cyanobacterium SM2_3_2]
MGSILLGTTATAAGLVGLAVSFRGLPDVYQLRNYSPTATTHIFDVQGDLITRLHGEANREVIPLEEVSPHMKLALLANEDSHFYTHQGINPVGLARAVMGSLEGGLGSAGGGSTITMQLVKNLFLTPDRALSRKMAEAVLAVRVEQVFEKDEILEMYFNQVYWGHNLYGIETASRSYFNTSAANLTLAQAAMLAGILPAPESFSPFRDYQTAKRRQRIVLDRLVELKWVTPEDAEAAAQEPLTLGEITSFRTNAPPITDVIEAELRDRYGEEAILRGGLRVQTTIDTQMQQIGQQVVNESAADLAARGASQMAIAAVDPRTGFIKVLVGGVNASRGQFNRATQAFRQTGSTFKPFVYYTALASGGYSAQTTLQDTPITYPSSPTPYSPRNYDNTFYGPISFAQSLALSRNVSTVRLADDVGITNVIATAQTAGITAYMHPNLATALGSASITPLEMASGFAVFANGGYRTEPELFLQVIDRNGQILHQADPQPELVFDPWATATTTLLLEQAVRSGTGTAAVLDDGRPMAGKTGTTSDFRDAWFIGYVPQLSTAMWIGNDDNSPMYRGTAGGSAVAPTWKRFMTRVLEGVPAEDFASPNQFYPPQRR